MRYNRALKCLKVFIGLHSTQGVQIHNGPGMEREGYDRYNLTLPGYQLPLVKVRLILDPQMAVFSLLSERVVFYYQLEQPRDLSIGF